MAVPILITWLFSYELFMFIGVDPIVCEVLRNYLLIRATGVPIDVINESYEKYLMSIGVMEPSMWSNVSFNVFILSFNSVFIFWFGWGYRALALSWVISTYLSTFVHIGLSLSYPSVRRTLQPPDWEALSKWPQFVGLGLPGTIMLCSEWWAFEILMLFATFLGTAEVAAQTVIIQIASMSFMVPLGIGVTCASLVGNSLGAGRLELAKQIGKLSIAYAMVVDSLLGLTIFTGGDQFIAMFTTDHEVRHVARGAIAFLSIFTIVDGMQAVASGLMRGTGKQSIGAMANVVAFYGLGLPMAYVFCFETNLGVAGLIMGISTGSTMQVAIMFVLIFCFTSYIYDSSVVQAKHPERERHVGIGVTHGPGSSTGGGMNGDYVAISPLQEQRTRKRFSSTLRDHGVELMNYRSGAGVGAGSGGGDGDGSPCGGGESSTRTSSRNSMLDSDPFEDDDYDEGFVESADESAAVRARRFR
jgi:multidrug resistance protein, MATE family